MKQTKAERFLEEFNDIDEKFLKEAMNYTMKKKFNFKPIIAVAACAVFALAAIPVANHFANNNMVDGGTTAGTVGTTAGATISNSVFTVLLGGSSDDSSGIELAVPAETDFDGISEDFVDETKIGTKKTIELDGKTYTGVYENSTISDYYKDDTDNYSVIVDDKIVTFSLNRETGVCRMFFIEDISLEMDKILTRDECYAKAMEHAKEYVLDIEDYEFVKEEKRIYGYGYDFVWRRIINGVKTSDIVSVSVRENGEVYSHVFESIGSMQKIDISTLDINNISEGVDAKIEEAYAKYSGTKYKKDIRYNKDNICLAKCANGQFVFVYHVTVDITDTQTQRNYCDNRKVVVELD